MVGGSTKGESFGNVGDDEREGLSGHSDPGDNGGDGGLGEEGRRGSSDMYAWILRLVEVEAVQ